MNFLNKFKTVLAFLLFISFFFFTPQAVLAQIPAPTVECDEVRPDALHLLEEEFQSTRPYQASPCKKDVVGANFCGNSIMLSDEIQALQLTPPSKAANCKLISGGSTFLTNDDEYECSYEKVHNTTEFDISVSDAMLPILGNTEQVINTSTYDEALNDAEKMTQYVNWYLSGSNFKSEYSQLNPEDLNDARKLVDFSGPIYKLLPLQKLNDFRNNTITQAYNAVNNDQDTRHDQVIGCTYGPWTGPCASNSWIGKLGQAVAKASGLKKERRLTDFYGKEPPKASDYDDFQEYWADYLRWRGKFCWPITLPDFIPFAGGKKVYLCGDDPTKPNWISSLYSNIPLSTTEDRKGSVAINSSNVTGEAGVTVGNVILTNPTATDLFFSHTEEVSGLAGILQATFVPKDSPQTGAPSAVMPAGTCDLSNIRTNQGDNLFPESGNHIKGTIDYDASFTCKMGPNDSLCKKDTGIYLGLKTRTPSASDIWSRTVAGPAAIFKRIFPQIGPGGPLECLVDIPAATKVTYYATNLASVSNPSGSPSNSPELYFPHFGSVSEYFLKGIQTALRPQGFGDSVITGQNCENISCGNGKIGSMPDLPSASGACTLSATSINGIDFPPTLISIFEAAGETFGVPPGVIVGVMFGEGAFNTSKKDNWTEENVQNWSLGCAAVDDCDPNVTSPYTQGPIDFMPAEWNQYKDAVKKVDPNREPNACNLMDNIFALAKELDQIQNGAGNLAGKTCYGIKLNGGGGGSSSCSWDDSDYETAIKMWESGPDGNCMTIPGSCAGGGGTAAYCVPTGDNCEKVGGSGNTSHNACVYSSARSH